MSTWFVQDKRTWLEWFALKILKAGPIPKHVAFIMDGNRRYAKLREQQALQGHMEGFKTLANVIAWCRDLEITEVTAYAFSIENFKRSKEEVDGLLALATEKFEQLLDEEDKLMEHGVCIRVIGDMDLLPDRLKSLAAKAMLLTKDNRKSFLNLALAYTSRDEISNAMKLCARGIAEGDLNESDISSELLEHCLYTFDNTHPDLIVRTSGETRLSDFLLWQSKFSCLFFTKVLWPELSIWHIFGAVFQYQRFTQEEQTSSPVSYPENLFDGIAEYNVEDECPVKCSSRKSRICAFKNRLEEVRREYLEGLVSKDADVPPKQRHVALIPYPHNAINLVK